MSLRANFLGVDLSAVRKFDYSEFLEEGSERIEVETEAMINKLTHYVYALPDNVQDPGFLSGGLGAAFEHFYKGYAHAGRPIFGFEMKSSWSIYAYLTPTELKEFLDNIRDLPPGYPSQFPLLKYFDEEDRSGTLKWFQEIFDQQKSLWFWAS
ncbi:MAG TPA: hypothetical protein DCE41_03105 [Cytophagales bacterium]|nr:hypothetical protein [Cytophagales bacterium]HAA24237.1 hypothetical protein [Cytophagales bacterium]HAP59183.1 hypothetical protein [Cytophagales bacterium]